MIPLDEDRLVLNQITAMFLNTVMLMQRYESILPTNHGSTETVLSNEHFGSEMMCILFQTTKLVFIISQLVLSSEAYFSETNKQKIMMRYII